jgi:hypothetical protein
MSGPTGEKYVLIKADQAGRGLGYVTHALDCRWVGGGNVGRYEKVALSKVPKSMGRCKHCGGGR